MVWARTSVRANKRGAACLGPKIAPIFFNTMEDSGALSIELDISSMKMGDVIDIYPYEGSAQARHRRGALDVRAQDARHPDRCARRPHPAHHRPRACRRAREYRAEPERRVCVADAARGVQVGLHARAEDGRRGGGLPGVRPGQYCEPKMTTVGSQTRPLDDARRAQGPACLGFSVDPVMQSFCHTAAYPKPVDVVTHHTLPDFIRNRGGGPLRPGDGIIHSWLNRMLLPDTVGTGDSHTRFPIGVSFPAGSGLVAFAAATGVMPLDMPESVLVKFEGEMQPGITLRDLVHAIPLKAIEMGLLTVEKAGKKNIFSGRVLEIEGLSQLKCEQAFELSDASAERSAAGCTIQLDKEPIIEYLTSNITMLKWMIAEGYGDARTLERRIACMENWIAAPKLLERDPDAEYAATIEIDLAEITEPILCAPNDPDDARKLSTVQGEKIDEVFIGSCMTNIGHFRAAGKVLDGRDQLPTMGRRRRWLRSSPTRATTRSTAASARAPRCRAALSAWATRRASATRRPSARRRRATSNRRQGRERLPRVRRARRHLGDARAAHAGRVPRARREARRAQVVPGHVPLPQLRPGRLVRRQGRHDPALGRDGRGRQEAQLVSRIPPQPVLARLFFSEGGGARVCVQQSVARAHMAAMGRASLQGARLEWRVSTPSLETAPRSAPITAPSARSAHRIAECSRSSMAPAGAPAVALAADGR